MPTPVVTGCLQTALVHSVAGQFTENVLHWNGAAIATASDLHDMLFDIAVSWEDNVLPFLATDCTFVRVDGEMLNGPGSLELPYSVPGAPIGDGGGTISSQEQSFCLTKTGGTTGRRNRGRIYLEGIPAGEITEGMIDTTWGNNVRDGLNSFAAQMFSNDALPLVILSRADLEMKPFSSFEIHDYCVDVQRRRLPGHNRHH